MAILTHLLLFLLSAGIIWFFAGMLVESVDKVAKRFNQTGFTVAFIFLGLLTSISEISVMVNSSIDRVPEVSAGNLVGASLVLLLLIVPFLAIVSGGVKLKNTITRSQLAVALVAALLPTLFLLDGSASASEGVLCLLVYGSLLYFIHQYHARSVSKVATEVKESLLNKIRSTRGDTLKILGGAAAIFISGHLLVNEAVYFSHELSVPSSIIGLLILSIGTNVPELVIGVRAVLKQHSDIAFGDYVGSALANTAIFGVLTLLNPGFKAESSEFAVTALIMSLGFAAFYIFARSRNSISKQEGWALIFIYCTFAIVQTINLFRFATDLQ